MKHGGGYENNMAAPPRLLFPFGLGHTHHSSSVLGACVCVREPCACERAVSMHLCCVHVCAVYCVHACVLWACVCRSISTALGDRVLCAV